MEQNKVRAYIFYAIGEILLVMIGILLALQVNNWNEVRKNRVEERFYLNKLRANLMQDTVNIKQGIGWTKLYFRELETMKTDMENEAKAFEIEPIYTLKSVIYYKTDSSTWGNLQSTGKISLIENQELSEKLYSYYGNIVQMEERKEVLFDYTRDKIMPFMMEFDRMPLPQKPPAEYKQSLVFQNILYMKKNAVTGVAYVLDINLEEATALLSLIDEELGN